MSRRISGWAAGAALALALCPDAARAQIVNGGFEAGDFSGWTLSAYSGGTEPNTTATAHNYQTYARENANGAPGAAANAVVAAQTTSFAGATNSAIGPTQGNFLAFVSDFNAPTTTVVGSALSQTFVVPAGATTLNFDVRYLTDELLNSLWDFGGVALVQGNAVLAQYNLDADAASQSVADFHITAATDAGAQGGFTHSTPWLAPFFGVNGLSGQSVTLVAYTTNKSDVRVESRLLLDNVRLTGAVTATAPEPAGLALLGVGLGALVTFTKITRRRG